MATWTVHLEGGPRRVNHAAIVVGSRIYSFGGYCSGEVSDDKDPLDVHVLNTDNYRWVKVQPGYAHQERIYTQTELDEAEESDKMGGAVPYQRYGHTVVEYEGKAYVWGGRNDNYGACNMVHEFDPDHCVWRKIDVEGFIPPSRDGHTAVVWRNKMYVFGGYEEDSQRFSQETFVFDFDTSTWREMPTKNLPPLWRDFHTASVIDGFMYIFGGRSDQNGQVGDEHLFHTSQDMYDDTLTALNLTTGEWMRPEVTGSRPGGRRSHSTWVYAGKMYMFGGYLGTRNIHYNELYCFNPKTANWNVISVLGAYPTARRRHCSVVCNGKVFLFGGTMPNPQCQRGQLPVTPTSNGLADLSDLHVLDFSPSLKQLAIRKIAEEMRTPSVNMYESIASDVSPDVRYEMYCQITPNTVASQALRQDQSG